MTAALCHGIHNLACDWRNPPVLPPVEIYPWTPFAAMIVLLAVVWGLGFWYGRRAR